MLPASISTFAAKIRPAQSKLETFFRQRLASDLSDLRVVSINARPKAPDSIYQKLLTGAYDNAGGMPDLVGLVVVMLYRRDIQVALDAVAASGLTIVEAPMRPVQATDFRYREPKLLVAPPPDYLERNPDLNGLTCEVQFTSALQHALDMTTHDFDYKGSTYSWRNFRLVAQLRAMLELVDAIIDDIESVSVSDVEQVEVPADFARAVAFLGVMLEAFGDDSLPRDRRRLADTVAALASSAGLTPDDLRDLLSAHSDLVAAQSLDPVSSVLGVILRDRMPQLLEGYERKLLVSAELESLCVEARGVPVDRRVALD